MAFAVFRYAKSRYGVRADAATADLIANHIKMFNDETFDTSTKVQAALDPLAAQLGFDQYLFASKIYITSDHAAMLRNDPSFLKVFKRYAYISTFDFEFFEKEWNGHESFKSISLALRPIINGQNEPHQESESREITNFFKFPQGFAGFLNGLTVREVRYLQDHLPPKLSLELTVEIANYMVDSVRWQYSTDGLMCANDFYNTAFTRLAGVLRRNQIEKIHKHSVNLFSYQPARMNLILAWMNHPDAVLAEYDQLRNALALTDPGYLIQEEEHALGDFVFSKMLEVFDVLTIMSIIDESSGLQPKLSLKQWLEVFENPDMYKDAPVSWWRSLLSD